MIQEHISIDKKSFHKEKELQTLISICPIYLIHPFDLKDSKTNSELLNKIKKGAYYILKLEKKQLFQYSDEKGLYGLYTMINNSISDRFVPSFLIDKFNDDLCDVNFFTAILQNDVSTKHLICNDVCEGSLDDKNNIYKLVSFILFGNPKFYLDIRIMVYYVLQCITYMNKKADIFNSKNNSELNDLFYADFLEKLGTLPTYYSKTEIKEIKLLE